MENQLLTELYTLSTCFENAEIGNLCRWHVEKIIEFVVFTEDSFLT